MNALSRSGRTVLNVTDFCTSRQHSYWEEEGDVTGGEYANTSRNTKKRGSGDAQQRARKRANKTWAVLAGRLQASEKEKMKTKQGVKNTKKGHQ